jgi:hypothetical protein
MLEIFSSAIDASPQSDFPFIKFFDPFGDTNLIENFLFLTDKSAWSGKGHSSKFDPNVSKKSEVAPSYIWAVWAMAQTLNGNFPLFFQLQPTPTSNSFFRLPKPILDSSMRTRIVTEKVPAFF